MSKEAAASRKIVLIVEDDQEIRRSLKETLEDEAYIVFTASTGAEALDLLRQMGQRPSLILLDLMMPGMNGWRFLEEMRREGVMAIPIVIVSAFENTAR